MKRLIPLLLLILTIGLLVACGKPAEQKEAERIIKKISGPEPTASEMATAREAYKKLQPEFDTLLAGKTVRLGKISGTSINEKGRGTTWAFVFYADKDKNNVDEYSFGWIRGKLSSGTETVFSMGLDTPDYDYMFKDIGKDWMDSPEIAKQLYDASGGKEGVSNNGGRLYLTTNSKTYANGAFWKADSGIPPTKSLYYDGKTGKPIETK